MTAKEKAKELYFKCDNIMSTLTGDNAKKFALIIVDEILLMDLKPNIYKEYWEEVKKEIEKL